MSFADNQHLATQEHFHLVKITLPIVTGKCDLAPGVPGYGTPLTCKIKDGTSAIAEKVYTFCTPNTPVTLPITPLYRCVTSINETPTELTSGRGLSPRGRANIKFADFGFNDPNLETMAGRAARDQGTFLGKFKRRNIFENKQIEIIKYRVADNINLATDGESTFYEGRELNNLGSGKFELTAADHLSKIDFDNIQFPPSIGGALRSDISFIDTVIPVDSNTDWLAKPLPYVIRVGDELMTVNAVVNNKLANAWLEVEMRGQPIGHPRQWQTRLSATRNLEHSSGDEVFICYTADGAPVAQVIKDMLLHSGVDDAAIPYADWLAEIAVWLPGDLGKISTVLHDEKDVNGQLDQLVSNFMLDLWSEPASGTIKLKAVSQWQETVATLVDGVGINAGSMSVQELEDMRYNEATVKWGKIYLTDDDNQKYYKGVSVAERQELAAPELYGRSKRHRFDASGWLSKPSADLLVSRFVQRYGHTPILRSWITEERFRTFSVGDVVQPVSPEFVGFDGLPDKNVRAQVIKIQTVYGPYGRYYKVDALTYAAETNGNSAFTITGGVEINLFIAVGAPPGVVDLTILLDGVFSSTGPVIPAIRAGGFAPGSTLTLIGVNGADLGAKGGDAGQGMSTSLDPEMNRWIQETASEDGKNGGLVYAADGIDTTIHLSGTTDTGITANAFLRSPGGGGAGVKSPTALQLGGNGIGGDGGGGGAGNSIGIGGEAGKIIENGTGGSVDGSPGTDGTTTGVGGIRGGQFAGDGGNWGQPGTDSTDKKGGAAGRGIEKGGAVVKIIGATAGRFINGIGETPD